VGSLSGGVFPPSPPLFCFGRLSSRIRCCFCMNGGSFFLLALSLFKLKLSATRCACTNFGPSGPSESCRRGPSDIISALLRKHRVASVSAQIPGAVFFEKKRTALGEQESRRGSSGLIEQTASGFFLKKNNREGKEKERSASPREAPRIAGPWEADNSAIAMLSPKPRCTSGHDRCSSSDFSRIGHREPLALFFDPPLPPQILQSP
jgi:hypothetical protein